MATNNENNDKSFVQNDEIKLSDDIFLDLIGDILDTDQLSSKYQKTIKSFLTTFGKSSLNTFSTFDLVKVNSKLVLNHFAIEDQFSLHLTTSYTCPKLLTRLRESAIYTLGLHDLSNSWSLSMLHELYLPYYEMYAIFKGYVCYQLRISARPCSSSSMILTIDSHFCNSDITRNPVTPKFKCNRLMCSTKETSLPATVSPPRRSGYPVLQMGLLQVDVSSLIGDETEAVLKDSIESVANSFKSISHDFSASTSTIINQLVDLRKNVSSEDFQKFTNTHMGNFSTKFAPINVMEGMCKNISVMALIAAGGYALIHRTEESYYVLGASVVACAWFNKDKIIDFILLWFKHRQPAAEFGFVGDDFFTGSLMLLSGMAFSSVTLNKLPKEVLSHLGSFSRVKSSLKDLFDFVLKLVDSLLKFCGINQGVPAWAKYLNVQDEIVKNFFTKTDEIYEKIRLKDFPLCADTYEVVRRLQIEGRELVFRLKNSPPALVQMLQTQNQWLTKLRQEFTDANFACDGLRPLPVCVILSGTPGTGKSQSLEWFSRALVARVLEDEDKLDIYKKDPSKFIYPRNFESVYWEGYNNDKIVCTIDDVFQAKDIAGSPDNEQMNLIRCVDEIPYCLHMAAIADKGNTYFTSKFVVCTTNMTDIKTESIFSVDALKRRLHLSLECYPVQEYSMKVNGVDVLDPSKLPIGMCGETEILPEKMLRYRERDNYKKCYTGRDFSFDEALDEMVQQYYRNKKRFEQKVSSLSLMVDKIVLLRKDEKSSNLISELSWANSTFESTDEVVSAHFSPKKGFSVENILDVVETEFPYDDKSNPELTTLFSWDSLNVQRGVAQGNFSSLEEKEFSFNYFNVEHFTEEELKDIDEFFLDLPCEEIEHIYNELTELYRIAPTHDLRMLGVNKGQLCSALYRRFGTNVFRTLSHGNMIKQDSGYTRYLLNSLEIKNVQVVVKETPVHFSWKDKLFGSLQIARNFIYTTFGSTLKQSLKWIYEHKGYLLMALGFVGTLVKLFKKSSPVPIGLEFQSLEQKQSRNKVERKYVSKMRTGIAQMAHGRDKNGSQLVDKYVRLNCYEIILHTVKGQRSIGFLTFIVQRLAIMQDHFLDGIENLMEKGEMFEDSKVELRLNKYGGEKSITFYFDLSEFVSCVRFTDKSVENDFVLLDFPLRVCMHKDIRHLISPAKDLAKLREYPVRLIVPKKENRQDGVSEAKPIDNVVFRKTDDPASGLMNIRSGYEYFLGTEYGDCGGWLTLQRPDFSYKLIGFHVAGDNGAKGFASAITLEDIEDLLSSVEKEKSASEVFESDLLPQCEPVAQGQFLELYETDRVPYNVNKTSIMKSRLHGKWFTPLTAPARLRPLKIDDGLIYPMEKALQKYCLPNIYIDKVDLEEARDMYFDTIMSGKRFVEKRLFTFEEAILGLENDPEFGSLTRKTSAGYPYNVMQHKKKFTLFGCDDVYDLNTFECKELRALCDKIILKAKSGIRLEHIFYDNLKDERRPLAKVAEGSTRMFSGSPVHLTVVFRMMFGAFILFYHKNRIENGSAIGVNCYSCEWHDITMHLLSKGHEKDECIGAGDFSRYDGSQKSDIHWMILEIINRWYNDSDENQQIRKVLWTELTNSVHLNGRNVVMWPNSLPSGHAMTAVVNTMYNNIAFRFCWVKSVKDTRLNSYQFDEYVYLIAMGDDNIFSVHPTVRNIYNEVTMSIHMKKLGLTYTNETKTESIELLRKIDSVEFLKRGFRKCKELGRFVAPLRLEVVLETPMWIEKSNPHSNALTNVDNSLRELALHGREIFDKYNMKMAEALKEEYGEWPKTTSYISNLSAVSTEDCPW